MALDPGLLAAARAAEARLIDADRTADIARADFHHAVRRLQLAGGSLREIGETLGLSHQRVHQIVEEAGGARPWRRRTGRGQATAEATLKCSFCGRYAKQVGRLIAGPGVYVCDRCVRQAGQVIASGVAATTPLSAVTSVGDDAAAAAVGCSFCGRHRPQVAGMAAAAHVTICAGCLELCGEIITEALASPSGEVPAPDQ